MSGKFSRGKGTAAEREVAALLGLARNARNGLAAGDLTQPPGYAFSIEVKRRAAAFKTLYMALEQAEGYDGKTTPLAVLRDDKKPWLVTMRLSDAVRLIPGLCIKKEEAQG